MFTLCPAIELLLLLDEEELELLDELDLKTDLELELELLDDERELLELLDEEEDERELELFLHIIDQSAQTCFEPVTINGRRAAIISIPAIIIPLIIVILIGPVVPL